MRVGLMRHFPVCQDWPRGWTTAGALQGWMTRYNTAAVREVPCDLGGVVWQDCVSSPLSRAQATATAVYGDGFQVCDLFAEVEYRAFQTGRLRLPVAVWRWLVQVAWWTGHPSQRACRDDLRRRVLAAANQLEAATRDTLVVSHAGMIAFLSAELRRRGFAGPRVTMAHHARAYVFERRIAGGSRCPDE